MISLHGAKARDHIGTVMTGKTPIFVRGIESSLPLVPFYRHIGIVISEHNSCAQDVAQKSAIIRSASRAVGPHVIRNRDSPIAVKRGSY